MSLRWLWQPLSGSTIGRTVVVVTGVLVLELLFIASYAGGLHDPEPHDIPLAIVAPPQVIEELADRLGDTVRLDPVADEAAARATIDRREDRGAVLVGQSGIRLIVSEAPSPRLADTIEEIVGEVARAQGQPLEVERVKPLPPHDLGLTPFYLALSWAVGGYLAAIVVALARGSDAGSRRLAVGRCVGMLAYAVASGVLGGLLAGPVMGLFDGHLLPMMVIGTLTVLSTALGTLALEALLGLAGTWLAIGLFVVLANPASGGPLPSELLRQPWRWVGPYLPTGAGTRAIDGVLYFSSHGLAGPLIVLAAYAIIGTAVVAAMGGMITEDPMPGSGGRWQE